MEAFRAGLSVFINDALLATLRRCCTVGELQLLICGTPVIDVADWRANTAYTGGYTAESAVCRGTLSLNLASVECDTHYLPQF